jgi:hypothetical protein
MGSVEGISAVHGGEEVNKAKIRIVNHPVLMA